MVIAYRIRMQSGPDSNKNSIQGLNYSPERESVGEILPTANFSGNKINTFEEAAIKIIKINGQSKILNLAPHHK